MNFKVVCGSYDRACKITSALQRKLNILIFEQNIQGCVYISYQNRELVFGYFLELFATDTATEMTLDQAIEYIENYEGSYNGDSHQNQRIEIGYSKEN